MPSLQLAAAAVFHVEGVQFSEQTHGRDGNPAGRRGATTAAGPPCGGARPSRSSSASVSVDLPGCAARGLGLTSAHAPHQRHTQRDPGRTPKPRGAEVLRALSRQGHRILRRERGSSGDGSRQRTPGPNRWAGRMRHLPHRGTDALDAKRPPLAPRRLGGRPR
jgi:hypothetical protein